MIVELIESHLPTWLLAPDKPPRTAGVHVSKVITAMLKQAAPRDFAHYGNLEPGREANWELGHLWEEFLAARSIEPPDYRRERKAERTVDGVIGAPDIEWARWVYEEPNTVWRDHTIIEEIKATWMSIVPGLDTDPTVLERTRKFAYWICQTKTYCAMQQEEFRQRLAACSGHAAAAKWAPHRVTEGRIRALFVNADYKDKSQGRLAKALGWRLTFTADELRDWWANVRDYAARHREELYEDGETPDRPDDAGPGD